MLEVVVSKKRMMKKDIPPVPDPTKPTRKSAEEPTGALDSFEEDVRINFEDQDQVQVEVNLIPELRNVFFEQDKSEKCIVVANEVAYIFRGENVSEFYSHVIRKTICRTFLVELRKRLAKAAHATSALEYAQVYKECKNAINQEFTDNNSVYIHDDFRARITELTISQLPSKVKLNDRWRIVQCLLDTCPIVAAGPALPVFSVEPVGRDGWTLTTYGEHPQQHQLFHGVPLTIAADEGLLYTATLRRNPTIRRLCMLDQTPRL